VTWLVFVLGTLVGAGRQSIELTVEAPPPLAAVADRIEAMDEDRVADSLARAGVELPSRVHVTLVAGDAVAARQVPSWVVGMAFSPDQIVIFPDRIGNYPYDSLEAVVLHELAHLALSARASGRTLPRWFHEGVAESVESGWGVGNELRLLVAAARDPAVDEVSALFASDAVAGTTTAYLLSAALVDDVRRRYGATVPGRIAARVGDGEPFEVAFARETGVTVNDAASAAWRTYRGLRWIPLLTSASGVWGGILALAVVAFAVRIHRRRQRRRQWDLEEREERQAPTETGSAAASYPPTAEATVNGTSADRRSES
jgi:hypothetical protein